MHYSSPIKYSKAKVLFQTVPGASLETVEAEKWRLQAMHGISLNKYDRMLIYATKRNTTQQMHNSAVSLAQILNTETLAASFLTAIKLADAVQ